MMEIKTWKDVSDIIVTRLKKQKELQESEEMVKLKTQVADNIEPQEGEKYTIVSAKADTTSVQQFTGIRVEFEPLKRKPLDEEQYATMLWTRETAGKFSKLGAFIKAFTEFFGEDEEQAKDTDNWIGHIITIDTWREKKRHINVES
jgi:DNA repair ATPase RecN